MKVCVDEEYGYRFWIWDTGMEEDEFLAFWMTIESIAPHYAAPNETLPGTWTLVEGDKLDIIREHKFIVHIHMDDDSYVFNRETEERIVHEGFKP